MISPQQTHCLTLSSPHLSLASPRSLHRLHLGAWSSSTSTSTTTITITSSSSFPLGDHRAVPNTFFLLIPLPSSVFPPVKSVFPEAHPAGLGGSAVLRSGAAGTGCTGRALPGAALASSHPHRQPLGLSTQYNNMILNGVFTSCVLITRL